MPNGRFESLSREIQDKLAHDGVNGVSEKDLLVLLVYNQDKMTNLVRQPFWKVWTVKELATAAGIVLSLLGAVNWQTLAQLLNGIAQASGR